MGRKRLPVGQKAENFCVDMSERQLINLEKVNRIIEDKVFILDGTRSYHVQRALGNLLLDYSANKQKYNITMEERRKRLDRYRERIENGETIIHDVTIKIKPDIKHKLQSMSKETSRPIKFLVHQAIRNYVDKIKEQYPDQWETIPDVEFERRIKKKNKNRVLPWEQDENKKEEPKSGLSRWRDRIQTRI